MKILDRIMSEANVRLLYLSGGDAQSIYLRLTINWRRYTDRKKHGHRVTGTNTGVGATPCIHQTPLPLLHRDIFKKQLTNWRSSSATPYHTIFSRWRCQWSIVVKDGTGKVDRQTNQRTDEQRSTSGQRVGVMAEDGKLDTEATAIGIEENELINDLL